MINVEIRNKTNDSLAHWTSSATAPFVKGDVINLDPNDEVNPREMEVIERQWHGADLLVLIVTTISPERHA